jgi:hypothetical protein
MNNIKQEYIEGFSKERFRSWKKKAVSIETNEKSEKKYIDCFIFSWIAFNHYYASYWYDLHRKDNERYHDEDAWKECIKNNELMKQKFIDIKSEDSMMLELPVKGGRKNDSPVPATKGHGKYVCNDLSLLEFLQICYRIRNNLIHGTKDINKKRDQECSKFAYKNLILFLEELEKRL